MYNKADKKGKRPHQLLSILYKDSKTIMATQTTNPAAQFLISFNDVAPDSYLEIPDLLIERIQRGAAKFYLTADDISDTSYSGKSQTDQDIFRIEIHDASTNEEGTKVKFKVRLRGILNINTGEMRPHKAGSSMTEGEGWLHGYNSTYVELSKEQVEEGIISQDDFNMLVKYALWWEGIVAEEGDRAPYSKAHVRQRLYITAANADFLFLFDLEDRGNPEVEDAHVIGINNLEWDNAHLIDYTPGSAVGSIGKAKSVTKGGKVSLPTPSRRVVPAAAEEIPAPARGR